MKLTCPRQRIQVEVLVYLCEYVRTLTRTHACLCAYMHIHFVASMHVRVVCAYFWRARVCVYAVCCWFSLRVLETVAI